MPDFDEVSARHIRLWGTNPPPGGGLYVPSATEVAIANAAGTKIASFGTGATLSASPRTIHTGNQPAIVATQGTEVTPAITETFIAEFAVLQQTLLTGFAVLNATAVAGNLRVSLYDRNGVPIPAALTAATAQAGTAAFQRIPFAVAYQAIPGIYYVGLQCSNAGARFRAHAFGNFGTFKKEGEVFGTFTALGGSTPTTFVADVGPVGTFY